MKLPEIKINFVGVWKFIKKYILRRKPTPTRNFGLIRDKPDPRDKVYSVKRSLQELPETTERRNINQFLWRYDQGALGSCVGNGVVTAFRRTLQVNNHLDHDGSRLYAYYNAREPENKNVDSGASIRDGIKGLNAYGLCKEETWPYIIAKFAEKPPDNAFAEGLDHQTLLYERIPQMKIAIMDVLSKGYAVVYGMQLYESFMKEEVARTGIVPYPKCYEDYVGGHCLTIFDYDKDNVVVLNSWGAGWGVNQVCTIPWKYILKTDYSFDLWCIKLTEQ